MNTRLRWLTGAALILWASLSQAAFHNFRLEQLYSNADGSVQFVVLRECCGGNGENFWTGQSLRATPTGGAASNFVFGADLPSNSTANKRVLVATPGFAALGIVTPDYVMPANFLPINGGTVSYASGVHQITYPSLPTDGVNALSVATGTPVPNVATNFAGASGSVTVTQTPTIVPAFEYYNASLDHYFITHRHPEIDILDAGIEIKGWVRTQLSFFVNTVPGTGTSPVCRFYIPPERGNSHFYGRGTAECDETALKFPSFVNEDPQFFHVKLPVQGVCPAGTIPVYRVFSGRGDANHRYTIDASVRDRMVSEQHWEAEGDGPDRVVMCVPPSASAAAPPPPAPDPMPPPPEDPYPGYP